MLFGFVSGFVFGWITKGKGDGIDEFTGFVQGLQVKIMLLAWQVDLFSFF